MSGVRLRQRSRRVSMIRWVVILAIAVVLPLVAAGAIPGLRGGWFIDFSLTELNFALITLIAALALQVLIGRAGLISIGSAGFYILGAMVGAFFGAQLHAPFEVVLVVSAISGALVGAIVGLPSLKLKGLYALLATLAFHFIAVFAFLKYEGAFFGTTGVIYPAASIFGVPLGTDNSWYVLLIVLAILTFLGARNLTRGRQGLALLAVRDQELAGKMSGVDVGATKVKAYAITSSVTTVAGTLYVYYLSSATVELFNLDFGISLIAILVIGGMNSPAGTIVGVAVWTLLPKAIKALSGLFVTSRLGGGGNNWLPNNLDNINNAIFGLAIIVILILRPDGLYGLGKAIFGARFRLPRFLQRRVVTEQSGENDA